jgi:hypothetical protein
MSDQDQVQLAAPQDFKTDEPISIDTGSVPNPITEDAAAARASKAHLGLGTVTGKSFDDIKNALQQGREKDFRQEAAEKVTALDYQSRQQKLFEMLNRGQVDPDSANELITRYSLEQADPDTIIEKGYAGAYFQAVGDANNPFTRYSDQGQHQQEIPEAVKMLHRTGASVVASREYFNTKLEDAESALQSQSTGGYIVDQMKQLFQPYNEMKLRGLSDDNGWTLNFLGTALKKEVDEILGLPLDEAKAKFEPIFQHLLETNPSLALMVAHYATGQSTDAETMDNIFSGLGLADVGALGVQGVKGARRLMFGRARQATEDIVRSSELVPHVSPPVAVAVGQGDLRTAAVQQAAENFVADTKGTIDPMQRARESMPTIFRNDQKAMRGDPGNLGTDFINRMDEESAKLEGGLLEQVEETARMNRVPELTASKMHFDKMAEEIKNAYPATANSFMNVKGPVWDPFGASWFAARIFGRNTAEYFASIGEAKNWARSKDIALAEKIRKDVTIRRKVGGFTAIRPGTEESYLAGAEIKHIRELGKSGHGYYITDLVPIDETSPTMRSFLGTTKNATTPLDWTGGYIDAVVGWLIRSPDETQSADQQIARKIATFAPSNYFNMIRDNTRNIRNLAPASSWKAAFTGRKAWRQFEQVLRHAQDMRDPSTGDKGWFFDGVGQLEDHYNTHFDRLPTEHEAAAYFEFKRLVEADRWFRTMSLVRNKQRIGIQSHTVILEGKDGPIKLPAFEGKRLTELPHGEDTVLFLKRDPDHTRMHAGNAMPAALRAEAEQDLKEGKGQVFEIYNTEERPFRNLNFRVRGRLNKDISVGNAKVRYVFARRAETRPLDLSTQIPRRFGGHLVPDYQFAIKQANMQFDPVTNTWHYEGDKLAYFVGNHALGQEFANKMNIHQALMREGKEEEALQYARDHLHIPAEDLHADYKEKIHPVTHEKVPPRWSKDEPFHVVDMQKGQNIMDLGKEALESRYTKILNGKVKTKFRDGTTSGNLARQSIVEFTGQRDAYEMHEVANRGTAMNPMYHLDPANLIDPMPMLHRGLSRIMRTLQLDDYKIQAIEHWLFAKNYLDPATGQMVGAANFMKDPLDAIQHSPFHYWNNLEWKKGFQTSNAKLWALMTGDKMKIQMFLGNPNWVDGIMRNIERDVTDSIYRKVGQAAQERVPTWMIGKLTSGPVVLRNILYSAKMGFFAPRQFFLHAVTGINAMLIDPIHAPHGSLGAMFHGFGAINAHPNVLAHYDMLASKSGLFKPGDWIAFRQGLHNSGFLKIEEGQHAFKDSLMSSQAITSKGQSFLHAGTAPFRGGVTTVKTISWYMAAAEWRNGKLGRTITGSRWTAKTGIKPVGAPGREDFNRILNRADDLAHNMTRASSSAIQKGFTSFGSQFTSFNQRVLELLVGKRLTVPEKIRLFFGYSAFYGLPAAGGIIGLSKAVRGLMQGNDPFTGQPYIPGQNITSTLIMEGMVATALYKGTGNVYNIGESFGAKDLDFADKIFNENPTWYDLWGGAALHGVQNTGEALTPFIQWADTLLNNDDERFRLTPQHFVGVVKEISSVNYAWRAYMGVVTGRWLSRNMAYLNNTSATNALIANFFGVSTQDTADIYAKSQEIHNWREMELQATKHISNEVEMEFQAVAAKNWNEAKVHHMNAKVYMQGIPEQQRNTVMTRIYKGLEETLKDKVDLEYYLGRDRPDSMRKSGIDAWSEILKMKQGQQ